jgi:hypothetical protein
MRQAHSTRRASSTAPRESSRRCSQRARATRACSAGKRTQTGSARVSTRRTPSRRPKLAASLPSGLRLRRSAVAARFVPAVGPGAGSRARTAPDHVDRETRAGAPDALDVPRVEAPGGGRQDAGEGGARPGLSRRAAFGARVAAPRRPAVRVVPGRPARARERRAGQVRSAVPWVRVGLPRDDVHAVTGRVELGGVGGGGVRRRAAQVGARGSAGAAHRAVTAVDAVDRGRGNAGVEVEARRREGCLDRALGGASVARAGCIRGPRRSIDPRVAWLRRLRARGVARQRDPRESREDEQRPGPGMGSAATCPDGNGLRRKLESPIGQRGKSPTVDVSRRQRQRE